MVLISKDLKINGRETKLFKSLLNAEILKNSQPWLYVENINTVSIVNQFGGKNIYIQQYI